MKLFLPFVSVGIILMAIVAFAQEAWINEFHYVNNGTDANNFVEIEFNGGSIKDFVVALYNGKNGKQYHSNIIISTASSGFVVLDYPLGMRNAAKGFADGIALVHKNKNVIEFLSYGGKFTATNGPAKGKMSTDVGVQESSITTSKTQSLQKCTNGNIWVGPSENTKNAKNSCNLFTSMPSASPSAAPSTSPSAAPSTSPSATPSTSPSATPSALPSATPSALPSAAPSTSPSATPSALPSAAPSESPIGCSKRPNGSSCVLASSCCSGTCFLFKCTDCRSTSSVCLLDSDCCSGNCAGRIVRRCT